MKFKAFLIIGPPGSGKGTQSRALCKAASCFHCSCGEIFRGLEQNSELGRTIYTYTSRGLLVPDKITIDVWLDFITRCECQGKFDRRSDYLALDGIPRSANQARLLAAYVDVAAVIHLDGLCRTELLARLRKRAIEQDRYDDSQDETILRRLDIYEQESLELRSLYPVARTFKIDAKGDPKVIHSDILAHIEDLKIPLNVIRCESSSSSTTKGEL